METFIRFIHPHHFATDAIEPPKFSASAFLHAGPMGFIFLGAIFALLVLLSVAFLRGNSKWLRRIYFPLALVPLYSCIFILTSGMFWTLDIIRDGHGQWTSWMDIASLDETLCELLAILLTGSVISGVFLVLGYFSPVPKSQNA